MDYTFYHYDGDEFTGNKLEFQQYSGESEIRINSLLAGRSDYLASGYALNKTDALRSNTHKQDSQKLATKARGQSGDITGLNNPNADRTTYHLYNLRAKVEFKGFRVDFCKMVGYPSKKITRLFGGGIWHDWVLNCKVNSNQVKYYVRRYSTHTVINKTTGNSVVGSSGYIAKILGVAPSTVSCLIANRSKTVKGYCLHDSKF